MPLPQALLLSAQHTYLYWKRASLLIIARPLGLRSRSMDGMRPGPSALEVKLRHNQSKGSIKDSRGLLYTPLDQSIRWVACLGFQAAQRGRAAQDRKPLGRTDSRLSGLRGNSQLAPSSAQASPCRRCSVPRGCSPRKPASAAGCPCAHLPRPRAGLGACHSAVRACGLAALAGGLSSRLASMPLTELRHGRDLLQICIQLRGCVCTLS